MDDEISYQRHCPKVRYQGFPWTAFVLTVVQLPWGFYFFFFFMVSVAGKQKAAFHELACLLFTVTPSAIVFSYWVSQRFSRVERTGWVAQMTMRIIALITFVILALAGTFWVYNDIVLLKQPWRPIVI
jgi:hypothetical protein